VVGAIQIHGGDEVILISDQGTLVRIRGDEVSIQGRNTQGVRLINLATDEKLVGMARVAEADIVEVLVEEGDDSIAESDSSVENDPAIDNGTDSGQATPPDAPE
jgi:DNA gyrase subunit A